MSFNKILSKKTVGAFMWEGRNVTLSVATRTTYWTRPDSAIEPVGSSLKSAVPSWTGPPPDTQDVCSRETDHTSKDPRDHITVVCFDSEGQGKTRHIPLSK